MDKNQPLLPNNPSESQNCGNTENQNFKTKLSPHCQKNCTICNSSHLEEIHEMKKKGTTLLTIANSIKEKYGTLLSVPSLSRHFSNFHSAMRSAVEQRMIVYLTEEVDQRAAHTSKLTTLINAQFDKIAKQWERVEPSIENLEKLIKLRYLVMEGKISLSDYDEQLKIIIENPGTVNFNQLNLWSPSKPITNEAEILPSQKDFIEAE